MSPRVDVGKRENVPGDAKGLLGAEPLRIQIRGDRRHGHGEIVERTQDFFEDHLRR